jgi:PAS domain-containing protein
MDHNPCLVFLKDESGRYVYLNETYERQFALTKDWYGQTDYDIWPKESAELFRANDREVLESG